MSHEDLVRGIRALEAIKEEGQYPGFSTDPMVGFRHLRHDIERFGAIFLRGGAKAFRALNKWVTKHPKKSGFAGLGRLNGLRTRGRSSRARARTGNTSSTTVPITPRPRCSAGGPIAPVPPRRARDHLAERRHAHDGRHRHGSPTRRAALGRLARDHRRRVRPARRARRRLRVDSCGRSMVRVDGGRSGLARPRELRASRPYTGGGVDRPPIGHRIRDHARRRAHRPGGDGVRSGRGARRRGAGRTGDRPTRVLHAGKQLRGVEPATAAPGRAGTRTRGGARRHRGRGTRVIWYDQACANGGSACPTYVTDVQSGRTVPCRRTRSRTAAPRSCRTVHASYVQVQDEDERTHLAAIDLTNMAVEKVPGSEGIEQWAVSSRDFVVFQTDAIYVWAPGWPQRALLSPGTVGSSAASPCVERRGHGTWHSAESAGVGWRARATRCAGRRPGRSADRSSRSRTRARCRIGERQRAARAGVTEGVRGLAAPKTQPSMNPSPKQVSLMITASGPHACSTVAAATCRRLQRPHAVDTVADQRRVQPGERAALPMPFDDGSSAAWSARVFHMSS